MTLWFWGWVVVAAATALVSLLTRDRSILPFAAGGAVAAATEAVVGSPAWEWAGFLGVSLVLFIALNRVRYRRKHSHDPKGRHSASRQRQHA